ncbi:MAG: hypothetical protein DWQ34_01505 [Planctomycetota bacterium]|nr:MAG: hypothetical protein DWQ29_11300 [Planctomycetota bacterium]REJ97748.1 MAG: hypothetical protein DWQ34_01505 [Planctomycetota bacterium]REK21339.1 MAG: hypothetical protein DWQ41_21860 [Planctomycetota bacterium]REK35703.1 MAG: hypothetical protein DWQ45_11180 [Planctomycetota bacterium]
MPEDRNRLGETGFALALIALIGIVCTLGPLVLLSIPATLISIVGMFRQPRGHAFCGMILGTLLSLLVLEVLLD